MDDDDDEEFGLRDNREEQQRPVNIPRSSSKELKRSKSIGNAPKFLKIAVIGDSTVGKTVLCNAVTKESYSFNKNYHLTCGVNVFPKSVKVPDQVTGQPGDPSLGSTVEHLNMALLDSSGKDVYLEYLPKYWDKLDGLVVVIDLTNPASLTNAGDWMTLGLSCCSKKSDILGVLIGNKVDLSERRKISPSAAQEFAAKNSLQYFECSVKENSGLEEPFFYLAHKYTTNSPGGGDDKENEEKR